jgi:hypothetical protein
MVQHGNIRRRPKELPERWLDGQLLERDGDRPLERHGDMQCHPGLGSHLLEYFLPGDALRVQAQQPVVEANL